jgi:hypothetical protein
LKKIGGIKVEFTNNLADHLHFDGDSNSVLIFHHATWLDRQNRYGLFRDFVVGKLRLIPSSGILPRELVDETLRTLALLFPQSRFNSTKKQARKGKWLDEVMGDYVIDSRLTRCGTLSHKNRQIENFSFYRDRLIVLKREFDQATPQTPSQWFYDRRNGV